MERQRSPSYPSLSLEQAIDLVGKIHKANRTNVISRETAAKDMGYAGLTGRSLTVLGSLAQYGLVERAGKGDIKVTRQAVEILHPIEPRHRSEAIIEAAQTPALFRMLHERFTEGVPSENALRSFLIQQNFNDVAIGPAIQAFLETNEFAAKEREGVRQTNVDVTAISDEPAVVMVGAPQAHAEKSESVTSGNTTTGSPSGQKLNEITMNIQGSRVFISGLFDADGIKNLEKKIAMLKGLLADDSTDPPD